MSIDRMMMLGAVLFQRSPAALWRRVGSRVVSATSGRQAIDILSPTASTVWALLEQPRTFPELISSLAKAYGVDTKEIASEVTTLLSDLMARGLLQTVADADD